MRKLLLLVSLSLLITLSACKKEHIQKLPVYTNETGYLLSSFDIESTQFFKAEYNNQNLLVHLNWGTASCDSFTYNTSGQLTSCCWATYLSPTTPPNFSHIVCRYQNDTIIRTLDRYYTNTIDVRKYTLSNNKIIYYQEGGLYRGEISFPPFGRGTTYYTYIDSNITKVISPFATRTYQPIDTFTYNSQYRNPFLTLGINTWTLITDGVIYLSSESMILGQSKNFPSVTSYAGYAVSDTTLTFSTMTTSTSAVVEGADENRLLPKVVNKTNASGTSNIWKFMYIKQN